MPLKPVSSATLKFIDENRVPVRMKSSSEEWIKLLNQIPEGKALEITPEELGVKGQSAKAMIDRLMKKKLVRGKYKVLQRTFKGITTLYIIHTAKAEARF